MNKLLPALVVLLFVCPAYAQSTLYSNSSSVGIGTTSPVASPDMSQKTDALALPSGTTGQRPGSPVAGEIRYNTSTPDVEAYIGSSWTSVSGGGGTSFQSSAGQLLCSGGNCDNSTGSGSIQYCPYKGNIKTTASQGNYTIPAACLTATLTSMYVGACQVPPSAPARFTIFISGTIPAHGCLTPKRRDMSRTAPRALNHERR